MLPLTVRVRVGGVCGMTVPSRWVDVDAPLLGKVSEIVEWGGWFQLLMCCVVKGGILSDINGVGVVESCGAL